MDASPRRELPRDINRSSGGFELAIIAALFAIAGLGLDRWLDTTPAFTLILFPLGIFGVSAKLWIAYDRQMREHEREGPWAPRS